jgi:branched-chain amino acid transport system permease protein
VPKWLRPVLFIVLPLIAALRCFPGSTVIICCSLFLVFMILAQGINIIYGFTGYLPFGYSGSLALAPTRFRFSSYICILLTPLFRLSGAYFSIANLAAALAVLQIVSNPNLESFTNGPYGISLTGVFNPPLAYATALAVLSATLLFVIYLRYSNFGMALEAIREDAMSAAMAGVNVVRARIIAWLAR